MQAGFSLTERAVEKKIKSFGLIHLSFDQMIQIRRRFSQLDELFDCLSKQGTYLPFHGFDRKSSTAGKEKSQSNDL
jgi:hypothetical protein